jgi:predicted RNA binding protein YcfA (HicA-like mRNA interferase family)
LLVSAGFLYLDRRGQHRIYGRGRTRVVVSFDGRPQLHPKAVRMIVEGIERSRPAATFQIDKTIVGTSQGAPPTMAGDLMLRDAAQPPAPTPAPTPAPVLQPPVTAAIPARAPDPPPVPDPEEAPPQGAGGEDDIDLPRRPKPKGAWS